MDVIVLAFVLGGLLSHAFSEKADEYSASQEAHREKYLAKLDKAHPSWGRARRERYLRNAARRNALGHFAYLLRHGWSSTFNDFGDGWKRARVSHEEWQREHPRNGERRGVWATFKAGWAHRWNQRPRDPEPTTDPTEEARPTRPVPEPPRRQQPPTPDGDQRRRQPDPAEPQAAPPPPGITIVTDTITNSTEPTNGRTPMEAPNLDAARAALTNKANNYLSDAAGNEQLTADMLAGGMGADADTMNHIAAMNEALATAAAHAQAANQGLGKHASGQEYANSGHAAKTDYLKSS